MKTRLSLTQGMRRTLIRRLLPCLLLLICATGLTAQGQKKAKKNSGLESFQLVAINSLDSATYELREIDALPTRIDLAEGIIKLLAAKKPARCRKVLDALFEDALQYKKSYNSGKPAPPLQDPDSLVLRVIKIAAAFDPKAAQLYADNFAIETDADGDSKAPAQLSSSAADLYLRLATELVEKDPVMALAVAEKATTNSIEPSALIFLETIRRKSVVKANNFFLAALQSVVRRQGHDINELFLLYSYVFSPLLAPVVRPEGLSINYGLVNYRNIAQSRSVEPDLAKQYLQISAQVILDSNRFSAGLTQLPSGAAGDLYFTRIIKPLAETYLPSLVTPLLTQQSLLENYLDKERRDSLQKSVERWNASISDEPGAAKESATLEARLKQADEAADPEEKDQQYYMIAANAVSDKKYETALDIVDKLSPKSLDKGKQFILFSIAEAEVKDNHLERAEQWARRDSDMTRRAFILNLIADALRGGENKDLVRVSELLREVESIATKLDNVQEKMATLIGAASVYSKYDNNHAVELLREAISLGNKIDEFKGDTKVSRVIEIGGFGFFYYMYYDQLTFADLLHRQSLRDFQETLVDIQGFKNRIPRIKALIDVCGSIMPPQSKAKS